MIPQIRLSLLYSLFATIAITMNLTTQMLAMHVYKGNHAMEVSMIAGTATGLAMKYILDKLFIFSFRTDGFAQNSKLFLLYSITGILTTAFFWMVEYGFEWFFNNPQMRYAGGVLGLVTGYIFKYHLDKRFVFVAKVSMNTKI